MRNHTLTIFVPGTTPLRGFLEYTPIRRYIYCPQGLTLAQQLPKKYYFYQIAESCAQENPELYGQERFYIFGWKSESVHNKNRMQAAAFLIEELKQLITAYYKQHRIVPRIQLIGYSHGGNVILNSAHYLPLTVNKKNVEIDVWLFATPVQQVNQQCVDCPYFTNIYSTFSEKDWIQRMDPQGLLNKKYRKTNFWSDRIFTQTQRCIQINFTVNRKSIGHMYYRSLFKHLPIIQKLIIESGTKKLKSKIISINFDV